MMAIFTKTDKFAQSAEFIIAPTYVVKIANELEDVMAL